ncbi:hypothetical protein MMC26_000832 [Xylographa opegraphella]|nr:hypothetical protein [Xylographa opegraphella]
MTEEPQQQLSIQARIAALNLGQVGKAPITATPCSRPVPKSTQDFRRASTNIPTQSTISSPNNGIANEPIGPTRPAVLPPPTIFRSGQAADPSAAPAPPPRLPPRKSSSQISQNSPALPPRRPSEQFSRRDSSESISSAISTISTISAVSNGTGRTSGSRAPSMEAPRLRVPVYDPSSLPPLPPKRSLQKKEESTTRIPLKGTKSTPSITTTEVLPPPKVPARPQRPNERERSREPARQLPPRDLPPTPTRPVPSPAVEGANGITNGQAHKGTPPPIPMSSRPDLSKILATKPKTSSILPSTAHRPTAQSSESCLKCHNFSGPDNHAAMFPRHSVPSLDWLATELTAPFPSDTDKARAIFTWLHHNVSYDVEAFFNDRVQRSTPISTLSTGLAVCEGYAALFTALATKAGLQSIVISGHGKGFGIEPVAPGAPVPPESMNHAWNAVRIDDGEWKLIDTCWGAGDVNGKGKPYNKNFKPNHFTMDNDEFGLRHFPTNRNHFYRTDGRAQISWDEYILGDQGGEGARVFSNIAPQEGLSSTKFLPKYLKLPVSPTVHAGPTVRFQFEKVCPHWDGLTQGTGQPFMYILSIHGTDGREADYVPFDTNGMFWWADVPPQKLGARGQTVTLYTVDTVQGNTGRGLSKEEYLMAKGRKAMGFQGVAAWELV